MTDNSKEPDSSCLAAAENATRDNGNHHREGHRRVTAPPYRWVVLPVFALIASVMLIYWLQASRSVVRLEALPPAAPTLTVHAGTIAENERENLLRREQFYRALIIPLLESTKESNAEAVDRCLASLDENFKRYRAGIKPFANDITSWGTRLGVLRRMASDWWYEVDDAGVYVQEKFRKHIFSEDRLATDLDGVMAGLREDIAAAQNRLLKECRLAVASSDLPGVSVPSYEEFAREVETQLVAFVQDEAKDEVYNGLMTLVASSVGASAATQVTRALLSRAAIGVGTTAVASAGAVAGTTGAASAGGAAAGSLAGPAGALVVGGIGLAVGFIIDWWMTDSFIEELSDELGQYIDSIESQIRSGNEAGTGLEKVLSRLADDLDFSTSALLRRTIVSFP